MVVCPHCGSEEQNGRGFIDMSIDPDGFDGGFHGMYRMDTPVKSTRVRYLVLTFDCGCHRVRLNLITDGDGKISEEKLQQVLNEQWEDENKEE